ncbi:MAG: AAA family ATPase, partial [Planctomycetota bacterium]
RARRGITLGWQEPARFEGLSVRVFIAAALHDGDEGRILQSLGMVGLEPGDYLDRAVDKTLSGGERKRIEMASILAMNPRLVIMDEPDSGIDVAALEHIFENLTTLKRRNTTVILITHSPTVLRQAEHAFLMCCGRIVDKGSVDKIARYFEEKCIPCDHKNRPRKGGPGADNG